MAGTRARDARRPAGRRGRGGAAPDLHQAPGWHERYSTPHAWVLADVEECDPVPVVKKRGCVVWTDV